MRPVIVLYASVFDNVKNTKILHNMQRQPKNQKKAQKNRSTNNNNKIVKSPYFIQMIYYVFLPEKNLPLLCSRRRHHLRFCCVDYI